MTIVFVKDDYGFDISLEVNDSSGDDVSLASISEVIFKMKPIGSLSTTVFGACTVVSAASGTCTYTVQEGDFSTAGNYKSELEITRPANVITTADLEDIYIKEDL